MSHATTGTSAGETVAPQRVAQLAAEIDLRDPSTILRFGSEAQSRATAAADAMLGAARNQATGEAGEALSGLLTTLRGFDVTQLSEKPGLMGRLARLAGRGQTQAVAIIQRYENVRGQIEAAGDRLDGHRTRLLEDVERLERLYGATLEWFHALAEHIAAGEAVLARTDSEVIPAAERDAADPAQPLAPQRLRDLRAARDELDRRVHDLRLTRQVAMQSLPGLRLIQENDKALAAKIHSVLANTVPLWRTQLAQALAIQNMREAGSAVRAATDLTNRLLTANAETLRQGNIEARTELERGVFDLAAVQQANAALVATLEDSLRIAEEGRAARRQATVELARAEAEIRRALTASRPGP
ncbi:toxic anion resistance protein [Pseudoroseomonas rhizosphaerae]|uniref:Toxic anion resistance protein n=1 Tax=Teichococcus rhizosphaerae TaxID=1335062 RepID=A0A2C7AHT2_9PROT|nr:toxic anion resistance protein [Pseudoroseomonas rhizosphaerae]PHK96704.1 toxic anion resistance protein [Pseudoroseomonas rhizosphaerae]